MEAEENNIPVVTKRRYRHFDISMNYLIDEVSKRANFTKKDTKIILKVITEVLHQIIRERKNFLWPFLFSLTVKRRKEYKFHSHIGGIDKIMLVKSERINFSPSRELQRLLKEEPVEFLEREAGDEEPLEDYLDDKEN